MGLLCLTPPPSPAQGPATEGAAVAKTPVSKSQGAMLISALFSFAEGKVALVEQR